MKSAPVARIRLRDLHAVALLYRARIERGIDVDQSRERLAELRQDVEAVTAMDLSHEAGDYITTGAD